MKCLNSLTREVESLLLSVYFIFSHSSCLFSIFLSRKRPTYITKISMHTVPFLIKGVLPDTSLMSFGQLVSTNPSSEEWTRSSGTLHLYLSCPLSLLIKEHCPSIRNVALPTAQHEKSELHPPFCSPHLSTTTGLSVMLSRALRVAKWTWPWATDASWCRDEIPKSTELRRGKGLVSFPSFGISQNGFSEWYYHKIFIKESSNDTRYSTHEWLTW